MVFIRSKKIKGHSYYYRVGTYLKNGKVRQKVVEYLGKEIPEKYLPEYQKRGRRVRSQEAESLTRLATNKQAEGKGNRHGSKKAP